MGVLLLRENVENGNKWNEYARKLYDISSRKYFRTGKQCRERWLNHLDSSKKQYFVNNVVGSGHRKRINK